MMTIVMMKPIESVLPQEEILTMLALLMKNLNTLITRKKEIKNINIKKLLTPQEQQKLPKRRTHQNIRNRVKIRPNHSIKRRKQAELKCWDNQLTHF